MRQLETKIKRGMPKITLIVILFLLLRGSGSAQNFPDAPSATTGAFPSAGEANEEVHRVSQSGAPPSARKPWIDPTVADATYWGTTFGLVGATIVNVEMTARCSEQHTCLTEIAPGSSRVRLYAYTLPTDAALSYLTYKLKSKTRLWMLPDALFTAANVFSAGRSYGRINIALSPAQEPAFSPVQAWKIPRRH